MSTLFLALLRSALSFARSNFRRCDYLLICHDNDRGYTYKNLPYSPLIDTVGENIASFGYVTASLALPFSYLTGKKATGNPMSVNGFFARLLIVCGLYSFFTSSRIKSKALFQRYFWIQILKRIKPTIVICIQPSDSLCAAGKRLGIPVYDLQHGVIEFNDPKGYYDSRHQSFFGSAGCPDVVLCWNDISANIIRRLWPSVTTYICGNPWVIRFMNPNPQDLLVSNEISRLKSNFSKSLHKNLILVTTQWSQSLDSIVIPPNVRDAIATIIENNIQVSVKFHPVELRTYNRQTLNKYAQDALGPELWDDIIDLSEFPLPAILKYVSYHVTGSSAATFEASDFKVKTGLWENTARVAIWYQEQLNNQTAEFLPSTPSEISNKIISGMQV